MSENQNFIQASMNTVMQPSKAEATSQLQSTQSEIKGYDLNNGVKYDEILKSYMTTGFQATNFARAVNEVNRMVC